MPIYSIPGNSSSTRQNPAQPWLAKRLLRLTIAMLLFTQMGVAACGQTTAQLQTQPDKLSAAEFSGLIRDISESGGYFLSDNFTSNETSYLYVIDKLRQLGATGGAYIGVGPEQNFTYIAKIRPRIAFVIDIRRQAVIQHLMYKAIFHLSPTRPEFLARLLSRPLPKEKAPSADAPLNDLLTYFGQTAADGKAYDANLAAIRKAIQDEFQFPLSADDQKSLEYVYKSFRDDGLNISFRLDGAWSMTFPTFREILAETDLSGRQGNFLATTDDYNYVRGMHEKNLIIPVVGDFGGKKALAAMGDYLRKNNFTVSAFYTSNVEQYLFDNGAFVAFANNVRKLPINDKSYFIRAIISMRYNHPAQAIRSGFTITLLQQMPVFLKDFDAGRYSFYEDMITTNYIAPDNPNKK
jgi:hypothetical protein